MAQRRELEYTAGCFPSVEINGTFYSLRNAGRLRLLGQGHALHHSYEARARLRAGASKRGGESDEAARERASRDVYCYFDNDTKAHAPFDARSTSGT
nr:DUF72 domain-containing protein [Xanthomonas oryzae]